MRVNIKKKSLEFNFQVKLVKRLKAEDFFFWFDFFMGYTRF